MRCTEPRNGPRARRVSRVLPTLGALASLGAIAPAQAQLQIVEFEVRAQAHATRADQMEHLERRDDTTMGLPWALTAQLDATAGSTAQDQVVTGTASATQTKTGWFSAYTVANHDWVSRRSELGSDTRYYTLLETTQPDTPLVLHFNFLGSRVRSDGYYSGNGVALDVEAWIAVEWNPPAHHIPDEQSLVWGFADRLDFASGYRFTSQDVDLQNIGTPMVHTDSHWQEMRNIGEITRDSFSGTLDFGLLQPGERFGFSYFARTNVQLATPYATTALAEVVDPFAFDDTPPPQFSFDGLTLPPAPVPEPASWLLGLAGLAVLAALHRTRSTPCAA
jgi:hypothetical protein